MTEALSVGAMIETQDGALPLVSLSIRISGGTAPSASNATLIMNKGKELGLEPYDTVNLHLVSGKKTTVFQNFRVKEIERAPDKKIRLVLLDPRWTMNEAVVWGRYNRALVPPAFLRDEENEIKYDPVTLNDGKPWTVADLIEELELKRFFKKVRVSSEADKIIVDNVSWEGVTVKEALEGLLEAAGLSCIFYPPFTLCISSRAVSLEPPFGAKVVKRAAVSGLPKEVFVIGGRCHHQVKLELDLASTFRGLSQELEEWLTKEKFDDYVEGKTRVVENWDAWSGVVDSVVNAIQKPRTQYLQPVMPDLTGKIRYAFDVIKDWGIPLPPLLLILKHRYSEKLLLDLARRTVWDLSKDEEEMRRELRLLEPEIFQRKARLLSTTFGRWFRLPLSVKMDFDIPDWVEKAAETVERPQKETVYRNEELRKRIRALEKTITAYLTEMLPMKSELFFPHYPADKWAEAMSEIAPDEKKVDTRQGGWKISLRGAGATHYRSLESDGGHKGDEWQDVNRSVTIDEKNGILKFQQLPWTLVGGGSWGEDSPYAAIQVLVEFAYEMKHKELGLLNRFVAEVKPPKGIDATKGKGRAFVSAENLRIYYESVREDVARPRNDDALATLISSEEFRRAIWSRFIKYQGQVVEVVGVFNFEGARDRVYFDSYSIDISPTQARTILESNTRKTAELLPRRLRDLPDIVKRAIQESQPFSAIRWGNPSHFGGEDLDQRLRLQEMGFSGGTTGMQVPHPEEPLGPINSHHVGHIVFYDPGETEDIIGCGATLRDALTHTHVHGWHGPLLARDPQTVSEVGVPVAGHIWCTADLKPTGCPHSHKIGAWWYPWVRIPVEPYEGGEPGTGGVTLQPAGSKQYPQTTQVGSCTGLLFPQASGSTTAARFLTNVRKRPNDGSNDFPVSVMIEMTYTAAADATAALQFDLFTAKDGTDIYELDTTPDETIRSYIPIKAAKSDKLTVLVAAQFSKGFESESLTAVEISRPASEMDDFTGDITLLKVKFVYNESVSSGVSQGAA